MLSREAVRELMPTFFELLQQENEPAVRVILWHFAFVHMDSHSDGAQSQLYGCA